MSFWGVKGVCEALHVLAIVIQTFFFGWFSFPWSLLFITFLNTKLIMERPMEIQCISIMSPTH